MKTDDPSSHPTQTHHSALQEPPQDEIDLIDLIRTIWDLRFFVVGGAIVGVITALTLVPIVIPTKYSSKLHVAIDINSLPAISTPEDVVKRLNERLGTERADRLLTEAFLEEFPGFSKELDPEGYLFDGRSAENAKQLPISFATKIGTNRFLVTADLPIMPPSDRGSLQGALSKGLNALVLQANKDAELIHRAQVRAALESARTVNTSTTVILRESQTGLGELVDLAARIQTAAFKLESKAASLGPKAREFLKKSSVDRKSREQTEESRTAERSADALIYQQSNERLSLSFSILAMLSDEKTLSATQVQDIRTDLITLQAQLDASFSERATFQRLIEGSATNLSEALRLSSMPIDRSQSFLPSFIIPTIVQDPSASDDTIAAQAGATSGNTRINAEITPKPGKILTVFVSLFLCSLIGLMLGFGLKVLPRALRARQNQFPST
jgi:hypothetical protein